MTKERKAYLEEKAELRRLKRELQLLRETCKSYMCCSMLWRKAELSLPVIEFVLRETDRG